jgi:hypothetical protein
MYRHDLGDRFSAHWLTPRSPAAGLGLTVAALYARDALIMPVPGWLRLGVVLYENVPRQLARLVRSMELNAEAPETPRFEVAWFDNSASDAARGVLEGLGQCQYRHSDANVGFGAGHNALMGEAFSAPEVAAYACVNPDAALHPRCVAELWAEANGQHRVGLVEARQLPEEHPKVYDPVSHRTPWCCGCVMLVTRGRGPLVAGARRGLLNVRRAEGPRSPLRRRSAARAGSARVDARQRRVPGAKVRARADRSPMER